MLKTVRIPLVVAALGCLNTYGVAQGLTPGEWLHIPNDLPGRTFLLNIKTIVPAGPYKKAWLLTDWESQQTIYGKAYKSVLQVDLYDCKARTFATRTMQLYEGRLRSGKLVWNIDREDNQLKWNEVPPDTPSDDILNAVCKSKDG